MSSPPKPIKSAGAKAAFGNAGNPANALQPPGAWVYLWLRFRDPDTQLRDFPEGLKVKVRHGTPPNAKVKEYTTTKTGTKSGLLTFPAKFPIPEGWLWQKTKAVWHSFTLIWDDTTAPAAQFILCEKPGATPKTQVLATAADLAAARHQRATLLPAAGQMVAQIGGMGRAHVSRRAGILRCGAGGD